ncbi:Leucine-rich receptor-like protein kinase family protein [Rhynchospora pubera]|uniref:non-specific serine/threonine protein kinase n=1 Tax=Rhynchospora pubera TaxID=906938 RepID=A0AAV8DMY8_9POAL|nr:Leucine-rich receptor-like protein kinase family protein [Rhynchospora pubera]
MPSFISKLTNLQQLALAWNSFTPGPIPEEYGTLTKLTYLFIAGANLEGEIPNSFANLTQSVQFDLSQNSLQGELPSRLQWNLTVLEIENNLFSGIVPTSAGHLHIFKAGRNNFTGIHPGLVAGMPQLLTLDLSENNISGEIPALIWSLESLSMLNLSHNKISGEIPASIGSMSLIILDLSSNNLSGNIPSELGNAKFIFLNLSLNDLSGRIPYAIDTKAYDEIFMWNLKLCSSISMNGVRMCRGGSNSSHGLRNLFIALGVIVFVVFAIVMLCLKRDYRKRKDAFDPTMWKLTSFQRLNFTENSIIRGITNENLIGTGGAGQVYCVTVDNHAGENGSLDRWLHEKRRVLVGPAEAPTMSLDWPTRLRIAISAARGLCYMHHECETPIVHHDVKSSNILLDEEFKAKIADFGLARILIKPGMPETVSALAGSFGYMAPECAYTRKLNEKVDVYSFGVVLLELTTGREAHDGGDHGSLAEWAWWHIK